MATILVEVLGSAKQFKAELDSAVASTERANSGFAKMGKVAAVAGLAIAGGVAYGLTKSVEAAVAAQQATARMNAAFAASHVSAKQFGGAIDDAEAKARKLGFTNESVRNSLGSLIVATHNGHKAISLLAVAQDVARFKGVSLEAGTKILTSTMAGNTRAAKQLGIVIQPVTAAQDAMKESGNKLKETILQQQRVVADLTAAHDKSAAGVKALKDAQATLSVEQNHAKDVTLSHTSALYLNEQAHAKLVDKLATANAAIQLVTEKLHGQADAYSKTAAGGVATFHAQLDNLEEQVGAKLLPALTTVTRWLVEALPVASRAASNAIAFLTPYFLQVKTAVETVVAAVRDHWSQISVIIREVVDVIRTQLNLFGDLIHGRWGQIWDDVVAIARSMIALVVTVVKDIGPTLLSAAESVGKAAVKGLGNGLQALPGALEAGLKALPGLALAAATLVGEAIVKGVKLAVPLLVGLAGDLWGKISAAISQVAGQAYTAAIAIGEGIAKGAIQGIQNMAGSVASKAADLGKSAVSSLAGAVGFNSPAKEVIPIGEGIGEGLVLGMGHMFSAVATSSTQLANQLVQSLVQGIQNKQPSLTAQLISGVRQAVASAKSAATSEASTLGQTLGNAISSQATAAISALDTSPLGQQLAAVTAQINARQNQEQLDSLNSALATASVAAAKGPDNSQGNLSPQDIVNQQASLNQAVQQAQQGLDDWTLQQQQQSLQAQLAAAATAIQQTSDAKATGVQNDLTNLQDSFNRGLISQVDYNTQLQGILAASGETYTSIGTTLGSSFANGFRDALSGLAGDVSTIISGPRAIAGAKKILPAGSDLGIGGAYGGSLKNPNTKIHAFAAGGIVSRATLAVVGEAGPEAIVPLGSGLGGTTINIYPQNLISTKQELVEAVRNELIRMGRNTAGGALGGFA